MSAEKMIYFLPDQSSLLANVEIRCEKLIALDAMSHWKVSKVFRLYQIHFTHQQDERMATQVHIMHM